MRNTYVFVFDGVGLSLATLALSASKIRAAPVRSSKLLVAVTSLAAGAWLCRYTGFCSCVLHLSGLFAPRHVGSSQTRGVGVGQVDLTTGPSGRSFDKDLKG